MICAICGEQFTPARKGTKCCSSECRRERNKIINAWSKKLSRRKKPEKKVTLSEINKKAKEMGLSYGKYVEYMEVKKCRDK